MALETPQSLRKVMEDTVAQINTILDNLDKRITQLEEKVATPKRGKANES